MARTGSLREKRVSLQAPRLVAPVYHIAVGGPFYSQPTTPVQCRKCGGEEVLFRTHSAKYDNTTFVWHFSVCRVWLHFYGGIDCILYISLHYIRGGEFIILLLQTSLVRWSISLTDNSSKRRIYHDVGHQQCLEQCCSSVFSGLRLFAAELLSHIAVGLP